MKIALVAAIVGIVLLYFASSGLEVSEKAIDKINKDNLEEHVKLMGIVNNVYESDSAYFLELSQPTSITVVAFKDKHSLNMLLDKQVEIIGEVDEYEGKMEIIANRIRVVD